MVWIWLIGGYLKKNAVMTPVGHIFGLVDLILEMTDFFSRSEVSQKSKIGPENKKDFQKEKCQRKRGQQMSSIPGLWSFSKWPTGICFLLLLPNTMWFFMVVQWQTHWQWTIDVSPQMDYRQQRRAQRWENWEYLWINQRRRLQEHWNVFSKMRQRYNSKKGLNRQIVFLNLIGMAKGQKENKIE